MKEFKPEDCLECPFCKVTDKFGDGRCGLYNKAMIVRAEEKPDFCKLEAISVKETSDEK